MTDSIAKELNECLCGIVINASTCLRMLSADLPNVEGARETARRTIRCTNRAAEAVSHLPTTRSEDATGYSGAPENLAMPSANHLTDNNQATGESVVKNVMFREI
jgi:hypothetical protein